jgi:hypothetical protein
MKGFRSHHHPPSLDFSWRNIRKPDQLLTPAPQQSAPVASGSRSRRLHPLDSAALAHAMTNLSEMGLRAARRAMMMMMMNHRDPPNRRALALARHITDFGRETRHEFWKSRLGARLYWGVEEGSVVLAAGVDIRRRTSCVGGSGPASAMEDAMATVRIRGIKPDPGFGALSQKGTVTVTVIIQSEELGRFEIAVHVPDQGDKNLNAQEARGALQRFSQKLSEALMRPLEFE